VTNTMEIHKIQRLLAHRYPFLLVDRVLDFKPGESIVAIKNVTINEPFFNGHFPDIPVMPGVLILEAMAQATGLLGFESLGPDEDPDELYFLVGFDKARFKRTVVPGDQLRLEAQLTRHIKDVWKFNAVAKVDGDLAAQAEIMTMKRKPDR